MEDDIVLQESLGGIHGVKEFEQHFSPELQTLAKSIDRLGRLRRLGAQVNLMNLVELRKQLDETSRLSQEIDALSQRLYERLKQFVLAVSERDQVEWLSRFKEAFHAGYPPVEGEFPTFQIFPVVVRVDFEHEAVAVNNRTVRTMHPAAVATAVEKEWDRLNRERFNAASFAKALLRAYDLVIAEQQLSSGGKSRGAAVLLRSLYQVLTLKGGVSSYSLNQFGFDLYRLRRSEYTIIDGRRLVFGTTRNRGGIVITLPGGQSETLASLEVVDVTKGSSL
ncbi:MAG: hypothetical protein C7B45_06285 [Sulfobacillus acidophilus]|uniref:Uncharacterized protein n=1 Tax=Sulfobacillus acidophilus TaxID=53633 RepID=A0A2T2WJX2_9FIRM|nr:MAG: hypothetical protein C7B45_06285 [Sulfobacillus acidophilus]